MTPYQQGYLDKCTKMCIKSKEMAKQAQLPSWVINAYDKLPNAPKWMGGSGYDKPAQPASTAPKQLGIQDTASAIANSTQAATAAKTDMGASAAKPTPPVSNSK